MEILIVLLMSVNMNGGSSTFSPGDAVGETYIDYAPGNQPTWQVFYDGGDGTHCTWMFADSAALDRSCAYNFRLGGSWYGVINVSSERAGWVAVGAKPSNDGGVCAYHMTAPGDIYRTWVAVDDDQGAYSFTEHALLPWITDLELIWPSMAIDDQDNIHFIVHEFGGKASYYTRLNWGDTMTVNPGPEYVNISGGVFGDRFNAPGKVIIYWTQWTDEGSGSIAQHAQDVWYMLSTDYGVTWGPKINLTQYQPSDTMRAFCQVKAIFDDIGDPHIVFATNYFIGGTAYNRSWIIHWSPATGFNVVAGPFSMNNNPGNWRLPCDYGNIALDRNNGWLYATYSLSRDTIPRNSDIMAKYSTDNGTTWLGIVQGDTGVNLTKTPPGVFCNDDYPCLSPYIELIGGTKSLVLYYIEDNDTNLPNIIEPCTVRVYFYPVDSLIRIEEPRPVKPEVTKLIKIYPNPCHDRITINYSLAKDGRVKIKILDITGRVVDEPVDQVLPAGYHTVNYKAELPAGIYFVQMETEGLSLTKGFTKIKR